MNAEKTIGRNGDERPAHPIITREVQKAMPFYRHGWNGFFEIADAAAIAIEETITREVHLDQDSGEHWSGSTTDRSDS